MCIAEFREGHPLLMKALAIQLYLHKVALDCHNAFKLIAKANEVTPTYIWGLRGNEEADQCAEKGAKNTLIGPDEPICGILHIVWHKYLFSGGFQTNTRDKGQGQETRMLRGTLWSAQAKLMDFIWIENCITINTIQWIEKTSAK